MKPITTISFMLLSFILVRAGNLPLTAGEPLENGYYVTLGVYAENKENYAKSFTQSLVAKGYDANYGFSPQREYYYVYTFFSKNYKESLTKMRELRDSKQFSEAWVYVHNPEMVQEPAKDKKVDKMGRDDNKVISEVSDEAEEISTEEVITDPDSIAEIDKQESDGEEPDLSEENKEDDPEELKLFFNVLNARTGDPIGGEVQIIDVERAKLLDAKESGDSILLKDPNNGTGKLALIVDNFGFRKNQLSFSYYEPDTELPHIRKEGDHYIVDFEMIRYHKGDIATMYNVYFFQDAALMKPESKYELNGLLNMMEENPDYKIKIHGHTNGNAAGKIISLGDSDNLFALSEENKEGFGSAKKLSKERAEMVKRYLIDNGIAENRMEVKGWGGKRMIHEKFGHRARHNVRVEIEILEE